jgi:hypothetical protein
MFALQYLRLVSNVLSVIIFLLHQAEIRAEIKATYAGAMNFRKRQGILDKQRISKFPLKVR